MMPLFSRHIHDKMPRLFVHMILLLSRRYFPFLLFCALVTFRAMKDIIIIIMAILLHYYLPPPFVSRQRCAILLFSFPYADAHARQQVTILMILLWYAATPRCFFAMMRLRRLRRRDDIYERGAILRQASAPITPLLRHRRVREVYTTASLLFLHFWYYSFLWPPHMEDIKMPPAFSTLPLLPPPLRFTFFSSRYCRFSSPSPSRCHDMHARAWWKTYI